MLKLVVTSVTLGSGASGGVFSPSLFMGATLGTASGLVLRAVFPGLHVDPTMFALAGMAGLVAGATGAALTAIVMLFEMTRDYSVVLPMTLTVAVSFGLRRLLLRESIYTMKLARRGHYMPEALQANAHLVHHVADVVLLPVQILDAAASTETLVMGDDGPAHCVLMDGDHVVGVIGRDWALGHPKALKDAQALTEVARRDFVTVGCDTTIFDVLATMQRKHAEMAVVVTSTADGSAEHARVRGVLTGAHLAQIVAEGMECFSD